MKSTKLPVIFRKWPESEGGGVDAIFPTLPGTNDPYTSAFYAHIGQHGSGDPNAVIQRTKAAKPAEYADLLKELHGIGYRNLDIKQRYQYSYLEDRRRALAEMDNPATMKSAHKVSRKAKPRAKKRSAGSVIGTMR